MRNSILLTVAVALLGAGCGGGVGDDAPKALVDCNTVPAHASAEHGQPARADGEVQVSMYEGAYVARRTVSLDNGFGGAGLADVRFGTANGSIASCAQDSGGYAIRVLLHARGPTEEEARAALDSMTVTHSDTLAAGALSLDTRVQFAQYPPQAGTGLPLCVAPILCQNTDSGDAQRGADIVAGLPAAPGYSFRHSTSNGSVEARAFHGPLADLGTSNGLLELDGSFDQVRLDSSNGPISLAGDHAAVNAGTSNGSISASLATRRSVEAALSASNGSVDVQLRREGTPGFDLTAGAVNGSARIEVAGTDAVGEQSADSAHRRSPGYEGSAVKVHVDAQTTNGDASIHE